MDAKGLLSRQVIDCIRRLRWAIGVAIAIILLMPPREAIADRSEPAKAESRRQTGGLVKPRRLTIGNHNHFMGVLGPDARYLYYITDEYNSYDLFVQSPVTAAGKPLIEASGDVVLPAISPDGKELAYLRYETDAQGDACRRRIRDDGSLRKKREECHATEDADLQIHWRADRRLGVLLREELHGDHILVDGVFEKDSERTQSNVVGLSFSPDERWVAYVPLARRRDEVGVSFSNRIGEGGIRIRRTNEDFREFDYQPKLPGVSGNPVFSPDGRYLYFSQFLNDTNRDGLIDGDDNGVLFRVRFEGDGQEPVFGSPRQLTNARWNCHYPSLTANTMAMTCAIGDNLHIYLLPPSGAVPADWDRDRVAKETEVVRDRWAELLLRQHLLVAASDDDERATQLKALTKLHLDLREYEAAIYYGERRRDALRTKGRADRWSELMILLAMHQRADRALSRGRFSQEYVEESIARIDEAKSLGIGGSPDAAVLRSVLLGKIYSDIGNKVAAREVLDGIDLSGLQDETVLDLAFQQFDYFYGLLADHDERLARVKEVALHPLASVTETLRHCRRFVDLVVRGRPKAERLDRLREARASVPDQTKLAMVLDVEIALEQLTEENARTVQEQLVRLYEKVKHPHARRYLVIGALQAARRQGVESLQHALAELWVQSVKRDDPERRTSIALYGLVVMERAYGAFAAGDMKTATEYFDRARRATGLYASHVGWIESQQELAFEELGDYYKGYFGERGTEALHFRQPPTRRFVEAYLLTRDLGSIESNKALVDTVDRARELLEASIEEDPHQPLSHLLLAHAMHHRGMRLGEREDMALAVRHYLIALDLAETRPRVRAPAHAGMALAQAALGNHRRALQDYEARWRLPILSTEEEVALRLNHARSLFQVSRPKEAIATLDAALELMHTRGEADRSDRLDTRRYEPLALDRLALYQLASGQPDQALRTHESLRRWFESQPDASSAINEIKTDARLATASLEAGHLEKALRYAAQGRKRLSAADPLRPEDVERRVRPVTHEFVYDENRLQVLLTGLEANAARQLGELNRTHASLLLRRAAVKDRYEDQKVDEDVLELAHTCLRLAEVAQRQRDLEQTRRYLEEGLAYAQEHAENTGSEVSQVGFHLLRAYAQLHLVAGVDLASYERDLEQDLLRYYLFLSEVRNPKWEKERKRFELFLSLLRMEKANETSPTGLDR